MIETATFDMYPVRLEPKAGESLPGYCWRFYRGNGHQPPKAFNKETFDVRRGSQRRVGASAFEHVFGIGRISPIVDAESEMADLARKFEAKTWYRRAKVSRHCVTCVALGRPHLLKHDLPLARACPEHSCWLISGCTGCGTTLGWRSIGAGWHCSNCGLYLGGMKAAQAPKWVCELSNWLNSSINPLNAAHSAHVAPDDRRPTPPGSRCIVSLSEPFGSALKLLVDVASAEAMGGATPVGESKKFSPNNRLSNLLTGYLERVSDVDLKFLKELLKDEAIYEQICTRIAA
ncbi:hypothetical protein PCE31107_00094 [Pandoraea cepalis]|uniref:TniQ domain-containing protein n=1 Tax=Pandoraea cepalis TaxID=2508294 RepID=A0A5E4RDG9_9BURK|nr:hypothetical protein PCE31107_00094 [Pandoraea cepalis]